MSLVWPDTGHLGMYVTHVALYRTLGNVCHLSGLIRDAWECMSLVWPYTGHLGISVSRLALHGTFVCHSPVLTLQALYGTLC